MSVKVTKIWLNTWYVNRKEIRVDFSNDRHHRIELPANYTIEDLSRCLHNLAENIKNDPYLKPKPKCEFYEVKC